MPIRRFMVASLAVFAFGFVQGCAGRAQPSGGSPPAVQAPDSPQAAPPELGTATEATAEKSSVIRRGLVAAVGVAVVVIVVLVLNGQSGAVY